MCKHYCLGGFPLAGSICGRREKCSGGKKLWGRSRASIAVETAAEERPLERMVRRIIRREQECIALCRMLGLTVLRKHGRVSHGCHHTCGVGLRYARLSLVPSSIYNLPFCCHGESSPPHKPLVYGAGTLGRHSNALFSCGWCELPLDVVDDLVGGLVDAAVALVHDAVVVAALDFPSPPACLAFPSMFQGLACR